MKRYIQITAGRGPEECCFAVAQVLKKLIKECKMYNCYHEVIDRVPSQINGNLSSALLWIDVKNKPGLLDDWVGTIQWVSQSPFRIHHKRKNWFIGVTEIPTEQMKDLKVNEIIYETFRSSGPGGQNVNKVNSGVRAIHPPTGLSVKVMDTRSQLQNRRLAKERLVERWNQLQLEKIGEMKDSSWNDHLVLQRGNPIKTFRSKDFKVKTTPKKYKNQRSKEKQKWRRDIE